MQPSNPVLFPPTSSAADPQTVRVVRATDQLPEFESLWDSIPAPWANPAQSYDFISAFAEIYRLRDRLEVVVSTSGGHAAIAPLYRFGSPGRLELVSQNQVYEATDFRYGRSEDVDGLARAIVSSGMPLRLARVPTDSPVVGALRSWYRGRGLVVTRPATGCPWIALDKSWEEPEQHLNAGRRSDVRRARRIAEGLGAVRFDVCSPDPSELDALLTEAYATESGGWKAQSGSALAVDASMGEFFRQYAAAACRKGVLRIAFVRIAGQAAATQLAVAANDRYWLLKIGYSEAFKRCSPGILLALETIRYAARAGLSSYEFLGAEEDWIRLWKPNVRACVSLWAYPFNLRGAWALAGDAAATALRKMRSVAAREERTR